MSVDIFILDHLNEECCIPLIESIRQQVFFDYNLVYLHDGPCPYKNTVEPLVDEYKENPVAIGCGASTIRLFAESKAKYAFYIQVDHLLLCRLDQGGLGLFIKLIEEDGFSYVDLAGDQGHGSFSERAQFFPVDLYNRIPKTIGGPGPWCHIEYTESCIQRYFKENDLKYKTVTINHQGSALPIFLDRGKYAFRSNPDGSKWKHRTDTKVVSLISGPIKEKYFYPPFSDEQWEEVIETQECNELVPEEWKGSEFNCWD